MLLFLNNHIGHSKKKCNVVTVIIAASQNDIMDVLIGDLTH